MGVGKFLDWGWWMEVLGFILPIIGTIGNSLVKEFKGSLLISSFF